MLHVAVCLAYVIDSLQIVHVTLLDLYNHDLPQTITIFVSCDRLSCHMSMLHFSFFLPNLRKRWTTFRALLQK